MRVLSKALVVVQRQTPVKRGFSKALERPPRNPRKAEQTGLRQSRNPEPGELMLFHLCSSQVLPPPSCCSLPHPSRPALLTSHQVLNLPALTVSRQTETERAALIFAGRPHTIPQDTPHSPETWVGTLSWKRVGDRRVPGALPLPPSICWSTTRSLGLWDAR